MNNVIEFPIKQWIDQETFDLCQENAREIALACVEASETLKEYALTLAMASGHALSHLAELAPAEWNEMGGALEVIALGGGLEHEE